MNNPINIFFPSPQLISNKGGNKEALAEGPYIAAKFMHRSIPYSFNLGNGHIYGGFKNRPLQKEKRLGNSDKEPQYQKLANSPPVIPLPKNYGGKGACICYAPAVRKCPLSPVYFL